MRAERLLAHYEKVADAQDAIPRLRRFILDLAVRGKLAGRDDADEPASALLTRITRENELLAKTRGIKAERSFPPVLDEATFDVPSSWIWTRLGVVTSYLQRGKYPKYAVSDGAPVVSQKCVQWTGLDLTVAKQITLESLADYDPIRFLRDGDLLWNSTGTGTIGRIVRVVHPPEKLVCDSHVTVVRCLLVNSEYVRTWLRSDHVYGQVENRAAGSTNQVELTAQMAINQVVPLPPLAEQNRIVAKVDELMALCDRLEVARAERETRRDRLAASSLARLNALDPETFQDDARFVLNALTPLTARPDQIKQLRQTILNLAVRGKLVRQDPKDEPAEELLKRIAIAHAAQHKAKKYTEMRVHPGPERNQDLPVTWCWTTTEDLCEVIVDCPHSTPVFVQSGVICLDTNSIKEGSLVSDKVRYVSEDTYTERVRRLVPRAGDLVFAREGSVGASFLVPKGMKCCLGQRVMLFRPRPEILPRYFSLALSEPSSLARLLELHKGIGAKHVNVADMRRALIPLPT
jgi:type I restriction enzyme, S subunit